MRQWANRSLAEALRRWTDVTRERSRVRHEMRKVALRWNQRQLSAAWYHWLAIREDTAGKLLAQEKAIALLTGRRGLEACREVLVRWSEHAALTARLRRLLSRRLEDNMERWLRTAMRRWRERALDNRCAKQPPPVLRFFSSDSLRPISSPLRTRLLGVQPAQSELITGPQKSRLPPCSSSSRVPRPGRSETLGTG